MFIDRANILREVSTLDIKDGVLTIPYGTKVINSGAIKDLEFLSTIIIPDTVVAIKSYAIQNTGIVHLEIPSSVRYIGQEAFSDNKWLTTLTLANAKTKFKGNMVFRCRSINLIQIDNKNYLVHCLKEGIPYHILAKRQVDVYQIFYAEGFMDDITYPKKFFAQKRDVLGEGTTIKEAMDNCHNNYLTPEIVNAYRDITLDTYINIDDYRRITGACPNGAQDWLKEHELTSTDKRTVREVVQLIDGEIGSKLFMQFIADRYKDRANGDNHG